MKRQIAEAISEAINEQSNEVLTLLEVPPNSEMGDFAFPCFRLAKIFRKSPQAIALELAEKIEKPTCVCQIKAEAAYVNFYLDKSFFAKEVIQCVLNEGKNYGSSSVGNGKTVVIDYSSPNIAKPFHVGHLRSTVIGNALYNIFKCLGYNCIGINHLGDWGTQFGKLIVAYKKWGSKQAVDENGISELTRIYIKFHDEAEKDKNLDDEARLWLVKMQQGDEEALCLWKWFNDISLLEFEKIYKKLNIEFDYYTGESFYNDKMDAVVCELREKQLLEKSDGAMIVNLEQFNMPPCLILRKDGGTLYPTRDISAAIYRKKTYDFDKCLYITAQDQNLHFGQWFKVVELMGYNWADNLVHIPFGLVSFEAGKLSTRKGNVVLMEDLLNEAVQKTKNTIEQKNPGLQNKEEVATCVGIGAVKFNDLYNSRIKDVVFSWERMLNFEGETGPYVQYANARACGILEKAGACEGEIDYSKLTDDTTFEVVKLLYSFPSKIAEAAAKYEPFIITRHLVNLAQAFNRFYHENEIITSDNATKIARLSVVSAVNTILERGLAILGIFAPSKM